MVASYSRGVVAGGWLNRLAGRIRGGEPPTSRLQRLRDLLHQQPLFDSTDEFVDAILAEFEPGQPLADDELSMLVADLRGTGDAAHVPAATSPDACVRFWSSLADRTGSAYARGCQADALVVAGHPDRAVPVFIEVFAKDPELFFELGDDAREAAQRVGGAAWLTFRLAELRALVATAGRESDEDSVREQYSALLDEYALDRDAMARIREVGRLIDQAVERGQLPRALVRRGRSRPRTNS